MTVEQAQLLDQRLRKERDAPFRQPQGNYGGGALGGLLSASGQAINSAALAGRNIGEAAGDAMTDREGRGSENTRAAVERQEAIKAQEESIKQKAQQISNIGASQFSDDPIKNIKKRITTLQGLVETHPTAASKIAEQESLLQEYLDSKGNRSKTQAEINKTQAEIENLKNKAEINKASLDIKKQRLASEKVNQALAVDKFNWQKQQDVIAQNNVLRKELDEQEQRVLKQKSSDSIVLGTIKSVQASSLPKEQKQFVVLALANKTIIPEQAWSLIKPPTEQEEATLANTLAKTAKLKKEGGGSPSTVQASTRPAFYKSIIDSGYDVDTASFKAFMANGDATALTQGLSLKDDKAKELLSIVDQSVELLDVKTKQDFLAFRTGLVSNQTPLKERIKQESQFLNNKRESQNAKDYNVKLSDFQHVSDNLNGLEERLTLLIEGGIDAEGNKVKATFNPTHYYLAELVSSNLHAAGSAEREVYNINSTLKSNSVLETMAELKRLSSTGSTGFGATSIREINLLESDIAALDPAGKNYLKNAASVVERLITLSSRGVEASTPSSNSKYKVTKLN